jgi:hypothetical protein
MRRITPEEVKAAYEQRPLKPRRRCYWNPLGDGVVEACGAGAVAVADGCCAGPTQIDAWLAQTFGSDYRYGFVNGFDGESPESFLRLCPTAAPTVRGKQGYLDGKAAAAAVFQET